MPLLRVLAALPCLALVTLYAKAGGRLPLFVDIPSGAQVKEVLVDALVDTAFDIGFGR